MLAAMYNNSLNVCVRRQVKMRLQSELAAWKAKCKVLKDAGSTELPKGKAGNVIARMYARTGWWPLKRTSPNWEKAISQFGVPKNTVNSCDLAMTTELGPAVKQHTHT